MTSLGRYKRVVTWVEPPNWLVRLLARIILFFDPGCLVNYKYTMQLVPPDSSDYEKAEYEELLIVGKHPFVEINPDYKSVQPEDRHEIVLKGEEVLNILEEGGGSELVKRIKGTV